MLPLFVTGRERLTHKRLSKELEHYADVSAKRAGAGRAGGKAKANASGLPPKPESKPKPDSHPSGESRAPLVEVDELQRQSQEAMEARWGGPGEHGDPSGRGDDRAAEGAHGW